MNLFDQELKQVETVTTSDRQWAIKSIGNEIWCCQRDGISVYDNTLHYLRHMKLGSILDASLLSQRHIVIAGVDGLRIVSKSGKHELLSSKHIWYIYNLNETIMYVIYDTLIVRSDVNY